MMAGCVCRRPPPTVDITSAFLRSSVEVEQPQDPQLLRNLQVHGWSPVVIDLSVLQERDETAQSPLARMHPTVLKRQVESLFAKDVIQENPPHYAIYRGRKSESGGSKTIEPKQSWEVSRCSLHDADNDLRVQLLERWTLALHSVAMAVSHCLRWPRNLLVQDDQCDLHHSPTTPCNVDLLRVFFYDRIIPPPNTTPRSTPLVLGSSPHSDWGSLTVVWQDDVGGLQQFCMKCRSWVDVAPAPITSQKLHLIVHLGDVTSLAMGHAAATANGGNVMQAMSATNGSVTSPTAAAATATDTATAKKTKSVFASSRAAAAAAATAAATTTPPWNWPSPRHRVLCSTLRNRASLVYFCYPPPGASLQDLQDGLQNYSGILTTKEQPTLIPYSCYSVLQNQSTASKGKGSTTAVHPYDVYCNIRTQPLHEVFAEKWQQVQRIT